MKDNKKMARDTEQLFNIIQKGTLNVITSNLVLAEISWLLKTPYGFSKQDAYTAINAISKINGLQFVDRIQTNKAVELYKSYNVKFVDCLLVSGFLEDKKTLFVSYDKELDKLGVKRVEPAYFTQT